ncbi:MAG TPA: glycosyltransferase family 2 protein [Thermoleophilaceae bacterium]
MDLSIVIVAFDEGDDLRPVLDELARQRRPGDEVVVVHNSGGEPAASARTVELAGSHEAVDRVIESGGNLGFPRAANLGASATSRETVLFLNPDALPEPGCLDALRDPPAGWDAWMGLVALDDGERVNTAGGVVHFLGFGWTGRYREPLASVGAEPAPVGFLSGACLAIRREAWEAAGAFPDSFFLYVDDVDLSHRLRLMGRRFGVVPTARVRHDYEFGRRPDKLRELERNRLLMVVRCYPAALLAAVAPALVATDLALLAYATVAGWGAAKARGTGGFLRALPAALRERRAIQARAAIGAGEFAQAMVPELDSPYFGAAGRSRAVRALLRAYWALVRRALG